MVSFQEKTILQAEVGKITLLRDLDMKERRETDQLLWEAELGGLFGTMKL